MVFSLSTMYKYRDTHLLYLSIVELDWSCVKMNIDDVILLNDFLSYLSFRKSFDFMNGYPHRGQSLSFVFLTICKKIKTENTYDEVFWLKHTQIIGRNNWKKNCAIEIDCLKIQHFDCHCESIIYIVYWQSTYTIQKIANTQSEWRYI